MEFMAMDKFFRKLHYVLLMLVWGSSSLSIAADIKPELSIDTISSALIKIEAGVADKETLLDNLDAYLEQLPPYTAWVKSCVADAEKNVLAADNQLEVLGEAVQTEPDGTKSIRKTLLNKKTRATDRLARCNALLVRDESVTREISIFRKNNLEEQSFARGENVLTVLAESITESHRWMYDLAGILISKQGIQALAGSEKLMLSSIIAIAVILGLMVRSGLQRWNEKTLSRWQEPQINKSDTGIRVMAAIVMTARRYIVPILLSLFVALFIHTETLNQVPKPLIAMVMDGLPILVSVFALTYFVYYALREVGLREDIDANFAHSFRNRLNILALIWFLGYLVTQTILANSLSEAAFFMARAITGVIVVLNVVWIIWQAAGTKGLKVRLNKSLRIISTLILFAALIAEFTGYRNLSGFAVSGVVGTLIAYALFQLTNDLVSRLLNDLDKGKSTWQRRIRQSIDVGVNDSLPGFVWLKLVASISVWLIFIAALLAVWRIPKADVQVLASKITEGFTLGSIEIIPFKIFEAIVVLVLLLALNGWFQRVLKRTWLTAVNIERGARESISTISNYAGVAIAVIIALGSAGMDFSKLAIIAGALSVGIGFGLRDIVNNFISGLILLFERPIKTGDWIVTNGVEGFVKKISIRSTEIESFDQADIIVPNSILISDNLTNWVHKNQHGRLRIPVSVAYGSNTERVKDLLIEIAREHQAVIIGHARMNDPKVLFLQFGDSSLDFELRFYVQNIMNRLDILSEINFAIDHAFRENEIVIPFPQRDVHVREPIVHQSASGTNEIHSSRRTKVESAEISGKPSESGLSTE
jgi:potassium efflux system protein